MDLTPLSNDEVCVYLAARIRSERLRQGFSQFSMSERTGIALRTYKRIELTGRGSIQNLVIILRALDRIAAIRILLPTSKLAPRPSIQERVQIIAEKNLGK